MLELQAWVTACRSYLQTDMGSYLLRSGRDDSLLLGDLQLHVGGMTAPLDTAAGKSQRNKSPDIDNVTNISHVTFFSKRKFNAFSLQSVLLNLPMGK